MIRGADDPGSGKPISLNLTLHNFVREGSRYKDASWGNAIAQMTQPFDLHEGHAVLKGAPMAMVSTNIRTSLQERR